MQELRDEVEVLAYEPPQKTRPRRKYLALGLIIIPAGILFILLVFLLQEALIGRKIRNRISCESNLRQIGQAILLYSNAHKGEFPDSFQTLVLNSTLPPQALVCSYSGNTPASGNTSQEITTNLAAGGHLSYVYLGAGLTNQTTTAGTIIAYEPLSNHASGVLASDAGGAVLFSDGHSEWYSRSEIQAIESKVRAGAVPIRMWN